MNMPASDSCLDVLFAVRRLFVTSLTSAMVDFEDMERPFTLLQVQYFFQFKHSTKKESHVTSPLSTSNWISVLLVFLKISSSKDLDIFFFLYVLRHSRFYLSHQKQYHHPHYTKNVIKKKNMSLSFQNACIFVTYHHFFTSNHMLVIRAVCHMW